MARVTGSVEAARTVVEEFFADPGDNARDRQVMARAAASLFIAGGLIGLASLLLPQSDGTHAAGIAGVCAISIAAGIGLVFERGRLPAGAFPLTCLAASVLIAVAVYSSGRADSGYAFYFVLVAMFVAYFLSVTQLV